MIVKKSSNNNSLLKRLSKLFKTNKFGKLIIIFLIFLFTATLFTSYGIYLHRNKKIQNFVHFGADLYENNLSFIPNYLSSFILSEKPIKIDIKFKHLDRINDLTNLSSKRGYISNDVKTEEFPAKLTYGDDVFRLKVSLTGQYLDHIKSERSSLNIEVKDGLTIMGMSKFKLLIPETRGYLADWIGHELQKREGLIVPRFDFREVKINGKNLGVFAIEEMYNTDLIENNNSRDGIIFKPDINGISILNSKKISSDTLLIKRVSELKKIWQSFINNEITVEELFDVEKFAIDYATTDLISGIHSKFLLNLRYYYNPISNLIEPISREFGFLRNGYAITGQDKTRIFLNELNENSEFPAPDKIFHKRIFKSKLLNKIYLEKLHEYSKKSFLDSFFNSIKIRKSKKEKIIYKDNPFYSYPERFLYENQNLIKEFLNPTEIKVSAKINYKNDLISLYVYNNLKLPIQVLNKNFSLIKNLNLSFENIIFPNDSLKTTLDADVFNKNIYSNNLKFNFKILGSDTIHEKFITKINNELISINPVKMSKSFLETSFVIIDSINKKLKINSGNYALNQLYIIPEGYELNVEEGVKLDFVQGGGIISYSAINFSGSKFNPILISSSDKKNKGLTFLNTKKSSNFKNVIISNLSNYNSNSYNLTGAITFYQSDVIFNKCSISDNISGDDLLNIFKSKFEIIDCSFKNSFSDALDADFSNGKIINSKFIQSGNDAIDISGTNLIISDLLINTAQDKALSAGENSYITGSNIRILNSEIGICSKDLSEINLKTFILENNTIGITAFQKKSKFGPGYLNLLNGTLNLNKIDFLIEKNSTAYLNNNFLVPNDGNLKDQFYGVKYGKSSK